MFNGITLKKDYPTSNYQGKSLDIENINKVFKEYGIQVDDVKESAQVVRYILDLPLDVQIIGKLQRAKKAIEGTLSAALCSDNISYFQKENSLIIERQGSFNVIPFGKLYTASFHNSTPITAVVLGRDLDGKLVYTDIAKAPHILIAGTTGSGKSETMHSIIASLLMQNLFAKKNKHATTIIDIIDMKGTEYQKYKDTLTIIDDPKEALSHIEYLCKCMEARYKMYKEKGCDDIDEYIAKGNELSRRVCIIDEFADLILKNRAIEEYIVRIAQKARACGIHLIIGTQSPRHDVVTGLIKANIPFRIALNTTTSMESRIILDETGAEKLFGKGDMLIKKGGNKPIRAQGCFVCDSDKEQIASLVHTVFPKQEKPNYQPAADYQPTTIDIECSNKSDNIGLLQTIKNILLWNYISS